jgi:eukaryotic-like serine/threonine-protein kinase
VLASDLPELDRYEVRRALGSGGIGVVYEATDRETGATVAIKTLHDVTPDGLYRLKREFRLLQGLEHPNVCQHYELFEQLGSWYIAMECVRGEHILQAIRDEMGDYDENKLRDSLMQLANALCALHNAGLVHRDLKPSNVLVESSGRVVLLDFGFVEASAAGGAPTRNQSIVGTPVYMAPEQAVQDDVGPAADWYSFGVILYEALTQQLPHDGDTALAVMLAKQRSDPPRASSIAPDAPPDLEALCADLLRLEPAKRPTGELVLRRLGRREGVRDSRPVLQSSPSLGGTSFVGRQEELDVLRGALADLGKGRAVSVIVEGPSGYGKSSLVRHFSNEATVANALVLAGRCYERESVPYKAFDSVIDALARHLRRMPDRDVAGLLPRHPDLLVRMFPVLGGVSAFNTTPSRAAHAEPHELRNQAFAALRELLHGLGHRRPLVITIDDWQWADADSVVLARDLIRHRESPPILLVINSRPSENAEAAARLEAVTTAESRRIAVNALAEPQAIQLAEQLSRSFAPKLNLDLAAIVRETHGHPLYISELIRYAATRGTASERAEAIHLDQAILSRIAELPMEGRAIIDVLAVAGEPLPLDVVRDAVELDHATVQRHAAMLRVAHLVRSANADGALEPYHDRVSEAVFASMSDKQRLAWHKRIIYAIEASPLARVRPELLLRHLDAAGESGRAAEIAIAAAQRAIGAGAFDQAASLFALALRTGEYDAEYMCGLRILMGQSLANAGRGHEAARAFLAAAEQADPATRLDCNRQAAEQLLMVGELERGLEILTDLLADVGVKMPATQRGALASVLWGRAKLRLRGLSWRDRRETEIAPETLLRLDVLQAASISLALVDTIRAADFNARWLLFALRIGERSRCVSAIVTESIYQSSQGPRGVVRARKLIERVRRLEADSNDPKLLGMLMMSEGSADYWSCNLPRAEELIRESERIFREEAMNATSELKTTRMFLTFTLRHRGAWTRLRELREQYVEDAERRGDRYVVTSVNRYCSSLWLAADDPGGARRMLAESKWMLPSIAFHTQHWYELDSRAEIAMYDHTVERDLPELQPLFEGLERSVLLRLSTVRAMALWMRGRLALCTNDRNGARHAAARLAKIDEPRARTWTAMLDAGIAGRAHDATAVAKLREAALLAEEHDLRLHAAASRYQLGGLLGGSEGDIHIASAEQLMVGEGVAKPARFADWFVPGLQK